MDTMTTSEDRGPTAGWLLDLSGKFLRERRFAHAEKLLHRALEWFEGCGGHALAERAVVHHRLAHVARARRQLPGTVR